MRGWGSFFLALCALPWWDGVPEGEGPRTGEVFEVGPGPVLRVGPGTPARPGCGWVLAASFGLGAKRLFGPRAALVLPTVPWVFAGEQPGPGESPAEAGQCGVCSGG